MKIIDLKNLKLENNKYIAKYLGKDLELNDDFVFIIGEVDKDLKEKILQSKSYILVINDKPLKNKDNNLNYIYVKDENLIDLLEPLISCSTGNGILNIDVGDIKCLNSYSIAITEKGKNVENLIKGLNTKLSLYTPLDQIIFVLINGHNLSLKTSEDIVGSVKNIYKNSCIYFALTETLKDMISVTVIIGTKDN